MHENTDSNNKATLPLPPALPRWLNSFSLASFAAGIVFATVNKRAVLGVIVGVIGGIYVQQTYQGVPNVAGLYHKYFSNVTTQINDLESKTKDFISRIDEKGGKE